MSSGRIFSVQFFPKGELTEGQVSILKQRLLETITADLLTMRIELDHMLSAGPTPGCGPGPFVYDETP